MPRKFLSDEVYAEAIEAFVIVCTDAAIINPERRTIFLAKRTVKPMAGLFVIGGRRFAGETAEDSMWRCFKRETSLNLEKSRFRFIAVAELIWKDRKQEPQNIGSHNLSYLFAVALTKEEQRIAATALDRKEYDGEFGLGEFDRDDLVAAGAHVALIDLYDLIFPARGFFAFLRKIICRLLRLLGF